MVRPYTLLAALAALAVAASLVAAATASRAHVQAHPSAAPLVPRVEMRFVRLPERARMPAHPARDRARRSSHHAQGVGNHTVLVVRKGRGLDLRSKPNGPVIAHAGDRTEFGSPTALSVVAHHGSWVGVTSALLTNGSVGWVRPAGGDVSRTTNDFELDVSLSRRAIDLRKGSKKLRTVRVAIGRPGNDTPTGRFAVTDKIAGTSFGAYYGCCILALSGHQTHLPPGWKGGDRLAIHGTDAPGTIGTPASAGCLRAGDADLHVLMDKVPLGTQVVVRR